MKTWSRHYDRCIKCGHNNKPHYAKGMCHSCYYKNLYKTDEDYRTKKIAARKEWADNHPEEIKRIKRASTIRWYHKKIRVLGCDPIRLTQWRKEKAIKSAMYYRNKKETLKIS